jgi:hypothetical protein
MYINIHNVLNHVYILVYSIIHFSLFYRQSKVNLFLSKLVEDSLFHKYYMFMLFTV